MSIGSLISITKLGTNYYEQSFELLLFAQYKITTRSLRYIHKQRLTRFSRPEAKRAGVGPSTFQSPTFPPPDPSPFNPAGNEAASFCTSCCLSCPGLDQGRFSEEENEKQTAVSLH